MANDKNKNINKHDDTDEGGTSTGGSEGGKIQFADFITNKTGLGEESLPPDEIRRLREIHNTKHKDHVEQGKRVREEREKVKKGEVSLDQHRENMAAQRETGYPPHPVLMDKAQFSGVDKQENQIPNMSETQTNDADRLQLKKSYDKKYQPEMGKKFTPPSLTR